MTERPPRASSFDHLVTVHAVLEGWLHALTPGHSDQLRYTLKDAGLGDDEAERVTSILTAMSEREVAFDTLSVDSLGVPGAERYQVREGAVRDVLRMFPGLAIMLVVLGFNVFGDGLNDALNPHIPRAPRE